MCWSCLSVEPFLACIAGHVSPVVQRSSCCTSVDADVVPFCPGTPGHGPSSLRKTGQCLHLAGPWRSELFPVNEAVGTGWERCKPLFMRCSHCSQCSQCKLQGREKTPPKICPQICKRMPPCLALCAPRLQGRSWAFTPAPLACMGAAGVAWPSVAQGQGGRKVQTFCNSRPSFYLRWQARIIDKGDPLRRLPATGGGRAAHGSSPTLSDAGEFGGAGCVVTGWP